MLKMRAVCTGILVLFFASMSSYVQAQQRQETQPTHILKLTAAADEAGPKSELTVGGFKVRAAGYASSGRTRVGYSWVDGRQYAIGSASGAELVHVIQGSGIYVDARGNEFALKTGDILLMRPGLNTSRDAHDYVHHFITFPAEASGATPKPQMQRLNPLELADADFTAGPAGAEHVYLAGAEGNRVVAWRLAPQGSVDAAPESRFVAIVSGTGTLTEGTTEITVAAGDSILIPKGVAYAWKGSSLAAVYVSY